MKICENLVNDYVSINIAEDETEWLVSEVYNNGDELRDGHFIYKYAGEDGTNTPLSPSATIEQSGVLFPVWINTRPTNYFAMLDGVTDTRSTRLNNITMDINTTNADTFCLLNLEASEVTLTLTNNANGLILYQKTISLRDESSVIDFYTYCFNPIELRDSLYVDDMELVADGNLNVVIDGSSDVKVGRLVSGRSFDLGATDYGVSLGINSFSSKTTDIFGNETREKRGSINTDKYSLNVPTSQVPSLRNKAKQYESIPILFIGDESQDTIVENLLNFGYWSRFSILIPNPVKSKVSISIDGIL